MPAWLVVEIKTCGFFAFLFTKKVSECNELKKTKILIVLGKFRFDLK